MTESATAERFDSFLLEPLDRLQCYKLLMGSVIPRPIAFVSTLNASGSTNAAPFSNFMVISTSPALLAFSVGSEGRAGPREKDTLRNIRANGEFVINTVPDSLAHIVQACSKDFPPDVSELDEVGLTQLPSTAIKTPRVAESKIQFECRLHSIIPFGESNLVVGHVVLMHAREGLVSDCKVDVTTYAPLARLGGRVYCRLGDLIKA